MTTRPLIADLHVHVGRARGRPIKITASSQLTWTAAVTESVRRKGLSVLGLVDCLARPLLDELHESAAAGQLVPVAGGGLAVVGSGSPGPSQGGGLLIIPGCEAELLLWNAPVHFLAYLPDLASCEVLRSELAPHMRNPDLGCQRVHGLRPADLASMARKLGGILGLAHAFTPHRGYFGSTGRQLSDLDGYGGPGTRHGTGAGPAVDFVEMGLSADAALASLLPQLQGVPLVASSDAHGAAAIGREATVLDVDAEADADVDAEADVGADTAQASFREVKLAVTGMHGRKVAAFYGLDPRLGKYHRTACHACGWTADASAPAALDCPACGEQRRVVPGVLDRVLILAGGERVPAQAACTRPPYHHHVPLSFLPGIGPAARDKLLNHFGSEIAVLHSVPAQDLARVAGDRVANTIASSRRCELPITAGGGGTYGRARPAT